jgi:hypothetical protein
MDANHGNSAKASTRKVWTWKGSRLQGMTMLVVGLALGYFFIIRPLQQAYDHASEVSLSFKLAFLSPVLVLLGILAIIVPSVTTDQSFILKSPNQLSFSGWVLLIVMAIVAFGTYYLLDRQIGLMGYK